MWNNSHAVFLTCVLKFGCRIRGTALGLYRVIQGYIGIVEEKMETRGQGPAIRTVEFGGLNADPPSWEYTYDTYKKPIASWQGTHGFA